MDWIISRRPWVCVHLDWIMQEMVEMLRISVQKVLLPSKLWKLQHALDLKITKIPYFSGSPIPLFDDFKETSVRNETLLNRQITYLENILSGPDASRTERIHLLCADVPKICDRNGDNISMSGRKFEGSSIWGFSLSIARRFLAIQRSSLDL